MALSPVTLYYSQSYHYIMSLQCLYVTRDSEERLRTKLTSRDKFRQCSGSNFYREDWNESR
jgi:hypothetical protein